MKKSIFCFLVTLFGGLPCFAGGLTQAAGIRFHVPDGQIRNNAGDIVPVSVYCMQYDSRANVTLPAFMSGLFGFSNPDPVPKVKVGTCNTLVEAQYFSFESGNLKSSDGLCLTRLGTWQDQIDVLSTSNSCTSSGLPTNYTVSDTVEDMINTEVAFRYCVAGDTEQQWELELQGAALKLKVPSEDLCLGLEGDFILGQSSYNEPGVSFRCGNTVLNGILLDRNIKNFKAGLGACSHDKANLLNTTNQDLVIKEEKILPIIIPM
ncbi:hypothetical protein [Teredinibacter sp. KSP-S5-2]|uniref:hypothetical protein n=1 Tax=Teredinibacter sp. KSP-S5-2 TaxID=3034506 RepID=UPI0029341407|nr:hypothetical protein [Teredinibacter sp. KSP-S5-2]WNO09674.1 hypothetical protein P5V12_00580 [Teredinibacter sp. KSP-S5-2]